MRAFYKMFRSAEAMTETDTSHTGYMVIVGPLTIGQLKRLMKMGLISGDTKARPETSRGWSKIEDIPELSTLHELSQGDYLEDILHKFKSDFHSAQGVQLHIPKQLYETLEDYLSMGDGEVFLTQGKSNGVPVFVVLVKRADGGFDVAAEIEIDPTGWPPEAKEAWPETGSDEARVWGIQ